MKHDLVSEFKNLSYVYHILKYTMNDFTQFKKHYCLSTEISKGESGYP